VSCLVHAEVTVRGYGTTDPRAKDLVCVAQRVNDAYMYSGTAARADISRSVAAASEHAIAAVPPPPSADLVSLCGGDRIQYEIFAHHGIRKRHQCITKSVGSDHKNKNRMVPNHT